MNKFCLWKHLSEICEKIKIIDVGAMAVEGDACSYKNILDPEISTIVGFEPNEKECGQLNYDSGNNCIYLPYFIGNGEEGVFRTCNYNMTSSFFEPNIELLDKFQNLAELHQVTDRAEESTMRLDDLEEIRGADYLKIDVQGSEIDVFDGAHELLRNDFVIVHTEVCFVPLYIDQPLFAEVDQSLRRHGFLFHRFSRVNLCGRALKPLFIKGKENEPISQALWADAVYVKDFNKFNELSSDKLLKMAIILHDVYRSWDMAHLALTYYDQQAGSKLAEYYKATLCK